MTDQAQAFDYGEDADTPAAMRTTNSLTILHQMAEEQVAAELAVAKAEEKLEEAVAALKEIKTDKFPKLLDELEMPSFTTKEGLVVTVKEEVVPGVNKADTDTVHEWVEKQGNGDLIKREFKIIFPKDEEKWAKKFAADLGKRKRPLDCNVSRSINHQTFKKYIKNKLEDGATIPEQVKIIRHRTTEITGAK